MIVNTTYGVGGFDESKPNNNIVEVIERINDNECKVIEYDGVTVVNETIIDYPTASVPDNSTVLVPAAAVEKLADDMADPAINSISEVKNAVLDFVNTLRGQY